MLFVNDNVFKTLYKRVLELGGSANKVTAGRKLIFLHFYPMTLTFDLSIPIRYGQSRLMCQFWFAVDLYVGYNYYSISTRDRYGC